MNVYTHWFGRLAHFECFNYFTHWNLALPCHLYMYKHIVAKLLTPFGTRQNGSVSWGLHCWLHLPALVQASFLCGVSWAGVSTASWVLEKSFSLCGQMRGSSKIAPLMTFLLSLELLLLPKDNFPVMTEVSDSINFHLSGKCGSN